MTALEALAQQAGYVLEISGDAEELMFYAWETPGYAVP